MEGQAWSGTTCSGTAKRYDWYSAMALGLGNGFGMPTKDQLLSMQETGHAVGQATVNATVFPNTPADWTLSATDVDAFNFTFVSFYNAGQFSDTSKAGSSYYVRLVQGGKVLDPEAMTKNYTINGDGSTVTHKTTGLTWKRCVEGEAWTGSTCSGSALTYTWATAMSLGTNGWGLPTKEQLQTLLDIGRASPYINSTVFPNPGWQNWASNEFDATNAWYVNFGYNEVGSMLKANKSSVRLVQSGTTQVLVSLNGLSLTCPATLDAGASGTCSSIASYSDGSSKTVTGFNWSTSNSAVLQLSAERLYAQNPTVDTVVTLTFIYTDNGVSKTATANVTVKAAGPLLTGLVATCPTSIVGGTSADCYATASYNNGSSKVVMAVWATTAATLAIDRNTGRLTAGTYNVDTPVTISAVYVEGARSQSATASVLVKPPVAVLTGLTASCTDASIAATASFTCNATAGYSTGRYSVISPVWSSSNTSALSVDSTGKVVAGKPSSDTVVTITATYTESGVTKSATTAVTVKAYVPVLTVLTVTCPTAPMNAGTFGNCGATATYNDGSSKRVNPTWYTNNSTALAINATTGALSAGKPYTDTTVIISAIYSEGVVSQSINATVIVKAQPPLLVGLFVSCGNTLVLSAGSVASCTATANYDDGSSKAITPKWFSTNATVLAINATTGVMTAGKPSTDTVVVISALYEEGTISKSISVDVTVKAAPALLVGLTADCGLTISAGATGSCKATANYNDGSSKQISPQQWLSTNATVLSINITTGVMTAGKPNTDVMVSISALYGEGAIAKSASVNVTVKASAAQTLSAPSISITPSETVAPGTNISIGISTVAGATSYQLCWGTTSGVYLGCATTSSPFNFVVPEGFDYFIAAKAINAKIESSFSNQLNVKAQAQTAAGQWQVGRLGVDYEPVLRNGNKSPVYSVTKNKDGVIKRGEIVQVTASAKDSDSAYLSYFWHVIGGEIRSLNDDYSKVEWRAPTTPGTYFLRGSVYDGDGGGDGVYIIFSVQ